MWVRSGSCRDATVASASEICMNKYINPKVCYGLPSQIRKNELYNFVYNFMSCIISHNKIAIPNIWCQCIA